MADDPSTETTGPDVEPRRARVPARPAPVPGRVGRQPGPPHRRRDPRRHARARPRSPEPATVPPPTAPRQGELEPTAVRGPPG